MKAAFEQMKAEGTIRYAGLSCHDAQLVEIIEAAAACGWIDHVMIQYNYRTMGIDAAEAGRGQGLEGQHRPGGDEDPGRSERVQGGGRITAPRGIHRQGLQEGG